MNATHVWQIAGWTMIHFAWGGLALLLLAVVLRWLAARAPVNVRYALSLVMLVSVAMSPIAIAAWLAMTLPMLTVELALPVSPMESSEFASPQIAPVEQPSPMIIDLAQTPLIAEAHKVPDDASFARLPDEILAIGETEPETVNVQAWLDSLATWLPWVWVGGAPAMLVMLCGGLTVNGRLRRSARPIASPQYAALLRRIRGQLGIARQVAIAVSDRVRTPILVGIVKPLILLPPAILNDWNIDAIELALLHELAHVRRWDNLANLLQRIVEAILFFHPAVWITSGWVRRDREECCDAIVVAHSGRPREYAQLLIDVAQIAGPLGQPALASAMARGSKSQGLTYRVRRILNLPEEPMRVSRTSLLALASVLLVALLLPLYMPGGTQADDPPTEANASDDSDDLFGEPVGEPDGDAGASNFGDDASDGDMAEHEGGGLFSPPLVEDLRTRVSPENADSLGVTTERVVLEIGEDTPASEVVKVVEQYSRANVDVAIRRGDDGTGIVVVTEKQGDDGPVFASPADAESTDTNAFQFPTMEEQRNRDLVHGVLHFEPEPVKDPETLAILREHKFKSGIRITGMNGSLADGIHNEDILVGLYVWPTTSIDDLVKILRREDLAELSPLKFYVLRPVQITENARDGEGAALGGGRGSSRLGAIGGGRGGEFGGREGGDAGFGGGRGGVGESDGFGGMEMRGSGRGGMGMGRGSAVRTVTRTEWKLVTGRIVIDRDAWGTEQARLARVTPRSDPPAEVQVESAFIAENFPAGTLAGSVLKPQESLHPFIGPKYQFEASTRTGKVTVSVDMRTNQIVLRGPKSQVDEVLQLLRKADKQDEASNDSEPLADPTAASDATSWDGVAGWPSHGIPQQPMFKPSERSVLSETNESAPTPNPRGGDDLPPSRFPDQPPPPTYPPSANTPTTPQGNDPLASNRSTLVYDGRNFNQWREYLKTELKVENRQEAINALAAFARAGMQEQALEAILEVAAECDFNRGGKETLEGTIVENLYDSRAFNPNAVVIAIAKRIETEPSKWVPLCNRLDSRLSGTANDMTVEALSQLAEHKLPDVRRIAVLFAKALNRDHEVEPLNKLLIELTTDDDRTVRLTAFSQIEPEQLFAAPSVDDKAMNRLHEMAWALALSSDADEQQLGRHFMYSCDADWQTKTVREALERLNSIESEPESQITKAELIRRHCLVIYACEKVNSKDLAQEVEETLMPIVLDEQSETETICAAAIAIDTLQPGLENSTGLSRRIPPWRVVLKKRIENNYENGIRDIGAGNEAQRLDHAFQNYRRGPADADIHRSSRNSSFGPAIR